MIREGQIVVFEFPQTDQKVGKLRPALVVRQLPGSYDDWLLCMISSQLHQGFLRSTSSSARPTLSSLGPA